MRVFADSFYFIALIDASDAHHSATTAYAREHRVTVVTTRWVMAEVADALCRPAFRNRIAALIARLERHPNFMVLGGSDDLFERGLERYASRPGKAWPLSDCSSFVAMEREGVREALTGDRHFAQAGFVAVFPE